MRRVTVIGYRRTLRALGRVALALCVLSGGAPAIIPAQAQTGPDARPPDPVQMDVMNTVSVRAPDLAAFPRWQATLAVVEPWLDHMRRCVESPCADLGVVEKVWLNRIQGLGRLALERRVPAVAAFLDDLLNIPPQALAQSPVGPWPTMRDILAGQGQRDGLALALARYYTLRATGVAPESLRIMVARDALTLDTTFVVTVDGPDLRLAMTRYGVVKPAMGQKTQTFIPLYAFNHESRWLYFLDDVLDQIPSSPASTAQPTSGSGSEETKR